MPLGSWSVHLVTDKRQPWVVLRKDPGVGVSRLWQWTDSSKRR